MIFEITHLKWALDKFLGIFGIYRSRPRLKVEYKTHGGDSGVGSTDDKLRIRWRYKVVITNITKEDALELAVLHANLPELASLGIPHIKALDIVTLEKELVRELDRATVVAAQHRFHEALQPNELRDLALALEYKNGLGITFYTDYRRARGADSNQWPLRKPVRPPNIG
ncbi:MAG: hypothetical protein WC614_14025 [bacterium]